MQPALNKFWETFSALHPLSRILLYISFGLGCAAFLVCAALELSAGRLGEYWPLHLLAEEITVYARSGVGLLGLSALIASCLHKEDPDPT